MTAAPEQTLQRDERPAATHVRRLVSDARAYVLAYAVLTVAILVVSMPPFDFVFPTLSLSALLGLTLAWFESESLLRRELTPLDADAALFEPRGARVRRRLLLGHLTRSMRLGTVGALLALVGFGLVTGVDRLVAVGGMSAAFFVYLGAQSLALAGTYARIEHDAGGSLVTTVAPPEGEPQIFVVERS